MIGGLIRFAALVLTAALVSSCASEPALPNAATRVEYGKVEAIEIYRDSDNNPIRVGTVVGGAGRAFTGHQIGSGGGNTVATISGAIDGAVIGHVAGREVRGSRYRVTVRLEAGGTMTVEDSRNVYLRVGDRVRVEDDVVFRFG